MRADGRVRRRVGAAGRSRRPIDDGLRAPAHTGRRGQRRGRVTPAPRVNRPLGSGRQRVLARDQASHPQAASPRPRSRERVLRPACAQHWSQDGGARHSHGREAPHGPQGPCANSQPRKTGRPRPENWGLSGLTVPGLGLPENVRELPAAPVGRGAATSGPSRSSASPGQAELGRRPRSHRLQPAPRASGTSASRLGSKALSPLKEKE